MTEEHDSGLGFAADHDEPIPYRRRISEYYIGLGFGAPYRWAHYGDVPFARLSKSVAQTRIALVTTAAPVDPGHGASGPGAPYNAAAKFFSVYSHDSGRDMPTRIDHVAIDFKHTTADDSNAWLPLAALRAAQRGGLIGEMAARFHGIPTNRSHKTTITVDCAELVARCKEDRAEAVLLLAN